MAQFRLPSVLTASTLALVVASAVLWSPSSAQVAQATTGAPAATVIPMVKTLMEDSPEVAQLRLAIDESMTREMFWEQELNRRESELAVLLVQPTPTDVLTPVRIDRVKSLATRAASEQTDARLKRVLQMRRLSLLTQIDSH